MVKVLGYCSDSWGLKLRAAAAALHIDPIPRWENFLLAFLFIIY